MLKSYWSLERHADQEEKITLTCANSGKHGGRAFPPPKFPRNHTSGPPLRLKYENYELRQTLQPTAGLAKV